jgi:hypothetical protein
MSQIVRLCPASTRQPAIGVPIVPVPTNPSRITWPFSPLATDYRAADIGTTIGTSQTGDEAPSYTTRRTPPAIS